MAEPGGSSRIFKKTFWTFQCMVSAPSRDKHSASAHRLKVGRALDGAELADAQHGSRYGTFQADRIGNQRPDVRMRLEDQGDAFDGGGVGAFTAFGEALLDDGFGVGEQRDAFAGFALAAEVVFQAFAIGGLREHACQRVLAEAARAAEEQRVRNALAAQGAAQGRDDSFIAEKFGEAHGSAAYLCDGLRNNLQDGG